MNPNNENRDTGFWDENESGGDISILQFKSAFSPCQDDLSIWTHIPVILGNEKGKSNITENTDIAKHKKAELNTPYHINRYPIKVMLANYNSTWKFLPPTSDTS